MGNQLSQEEIRERKQELDKILQLRFPSLNIGSQNGATGYLDFIKPEDLTTNNIMSGYDFAYRPFVVFKAEIELNNGNKIQTFSTFFQRYSDNLLTWHICGHYGRNLFFTDGGASNSQIKVLYELLSSGSYVITPDKLDNLRLNWMSDNQYNEIDIPESEFPKKIIIGYTD